jgi:Protein of unknown function (DUF3142)
MGNFLTLAKKSMLIPLWMISSIVGSVLLTVLYLDSSSILSSSTKMPTAPKLFLWAWERPESLEFIDPQKVGVAFLAETINLQGSEVIFHPRLQPLKVPTGTSLVAVVRIETDIKDRPLLSDEQRGEILTSIMEMARRPDLTGLQIDFDAKVSERPFYQALLYGLRQQIPKNLTFSITALASWCIGDNWLSGLPIDEAVPMLFDMGIDSRSVKNYLQSGQDFQAPLCRHSNGVSTNETVAGLHTSRRFYVFSPKRWSPSVLKQYQQKNSGS